LVRAGSVPPFQLASVPTTSPPFELETQADPLDRQTIKLKPYRAALGAVDEFNPVVDGS